MNRLDLTAQQIVASNPKLKQLKKLFSKRKARDEASSFVIEGFRLVLAAVASNVEVLELYGSQSQLEALSDALEESASQPDNVASVYEVDPSVLSSALATNNPQPIAAVMRQPQYSWEDIGASAMVLVPVELADPGNLGTIMRTAAAAGAAVAIVGDSVDVYNPKTVRATAGTIFHLSFVVERSLADAIKNLKASGLKIAASTLSDDAADYHTVDLKNVALLLGNEPHGLSDEAVTLSDLAVKIPIAEPVESLNVASAAAVFCFESARQRAAEPASA